MEGHSGPVLAVVISSDDRRVYSASSDQSVRVWEVTFIEVQYVAALIAAPPPPARVRGWAATQL
jgi:WD40 repeat protein